MGKVIGTRKSGESWKNLEEKEVDKDVLNDFIKENFPGLNLDDKKFKWKDTNESFSFGFNVDEKK